MPVTDWLYRVVVSPRSQLLAQRLRAQVCLQMVGVKTILIFLIFSVRFSPAERGLWVQGAGLRWGTAVTSRGWLARPTRNWLESIPRAFAKSLLDVRSHSGGRVTAHGPTSPGGMPMGQQLSSGFMHNDSQPSGVLF